MLPYLRYMLAAVCFAACVVCLALWWRSNLHYRALQLPTLVAGIEVRGNTLEGMLNLFARQDDSVRTWKYTSAPVSQQAAAALAEPLEGRVFGLRQVGTTYWGFFPLWYPALIFALAGVGALRLRRQFSIRSALICLTVVAALLGMAVGL